MQTDFDVVDGIASIVGEERAYSEEMHHMTEHSIELASVWFNHHKRGKDFSVVPVLCGSYHHYVVSGGMPDDDERTAKVIAYLRRVMQERKTVVIAAGDLSHVGPAFGDDSPLDAVAKAKLSAEDRNSMADICAGDADGFFRRTQQEKDARKICGLSPIYLMLKLLDDVKGESLAYDQCPADAQGGSVVSIAGALLYGR
jgi:hypothetical protein